MPQVTRTKPLLVSPPAENRIRVGTATEAISRGQLVKLTAAGWSKLPAAAVNADGIALKDYFLGQGGCDFGITGEMDGFDLTGITVGDALFPSATVAGNIQSEYPVTATAAAGAASPVTANVHMRALTSTRIGFNFP